MKKKQNAGLKDFDLFGQAIIVSGHILVGDGG
jgi:hypothetical protein